MSLEPRTRGRRGIAHRAHRSERTISRWVASGILPDDRDGPFQNSALEIRNADIDALRRRGGEEE